MVVTYGVDSPARDSRLNHTRNIYGTAYHVSIYLIVVRARARDPAASVMKTCLCNARYVIFQCIKRGQAWNRINDGVR